MAASGLFTWWTSLLKPAEMRRAAEVAELLPSGLGTRRSGKIARAAVSERQRLTEETALERTRLLTEERNQRDAALADEISKLDAPKAELTLALARLLPPIARAGKISYCLQGRSRKCRSTLGRGTCTSHGRSTSRGSVVGCSIDFRTPLRDALIENTPWWQPPRGCGATRLAARLSIKPFDISF